MFEFQPPDPTITAGTHALVIGVNQYRHLAGGGDNHRASVLRGLGQLTSPVPSATHFANWLMHSYDNPDAPLRSMQVLLSPGPFINSKDGSETAVKAATLANITSAFRAWEARCTSQNGNVAVFYFCGHGFEHGAHCLLPEDFGNDIEPEVWLTCINFNLTFEAMARAAVQSQCYFIDACRDDPGAQVDVPNQLGKPLKGTSFDRAIPRDGAVYQAAWPSSTATGIDKKVSPFSRALVDCLSKYGASTTHIEGDQGPWWVTTGSLRESLHTYLSHDTVNKEIVQSSSMSKCDIEPVRLHRQDPSHCGVLCPVRIEPTAAEAEATIEFSQSGTSQARFNPTTPPQTWCAKIARGTWDMDARFTTFQNIQRSQMMHPPVHRISIKTQQLPPPGAT